MNSPNKIKQYAALACLFAVTCFLGFGVTKFFKPETTAPISTGNVGQNVKDGPIGGIDNPIVPSPNVTTDSTKKDIKVPQFPAPTEVKLSASRPTKNGNGYSFQARCSGMPQGIAYHYELWSSRMVQKSANGNFSNVPANAKGSYTLIVVGDTDSRTYAKIVVSGFDKAADRMSKSEFQSLLLRLKDTTLLGGKNPKVAKSVAIRTSGLRNGDRAPGDILAIRDKIANGIWQTVNVTDVNYNDKDQISAITIQPVYPAENE